jgi:hypothetical protein
MILPSSTFDDILFPMTAEVYYAETIQTEYGNIIKNWVRDREIHCSVISELSNRSFAGEVKTKGTDLLYDSNAFLRTKEDIRKRPNGKYYAITDIAVTNIKDPSGNYVWINAQNLNNSAGPVKTKYEVKTVVPTFDYNHNLRHFRVFITKSQIQKWDQS